MPISKNPDFSIFTCCYNRASTLPRTYKSLCEQTHRNFEWIVFDNGSTDNTSELLAAWKEEADFPVKILGWPDNTGYQRTFNEGLKVSDGELWMMLDSDDACVPHALERVWEIWQGIPEDKRHQYSGVTVNCNDQHGNLVGTLFPEDIFDSNSLETYYKHKIKGEKWGCQRVDVLRKFPFPDTENHVSPGLVWRAIAREYTTRYANDRLRIYYIHETGRADQFSFHLANREIAFSRRLNSQDKLNKDMDWFRVSPLTFLKQAVVYTQFSDLLDLGFSQQLKDIDKPLGKFLVAAAYPFGSLLSFLSRRAES